MDAMTPLTVSTISSSQMNFSLLSFTPETVGTIEITQQTIEPVSPTVFSPQSTLPSTLPPIRATPAKKPTKTPTAPCKFPPVTFTVCRNWLDCDGLEFLDGLCSNCYDNESGIKRKLFEEQ